MCQLHCNILHQKHSNTYLYFLCYGSIWMTTTTKTTTQYQNLLVIFCNCELTCCQQLESVPIGHVSENLKIFGKKPFPTAQIDLIQVKKTPLDSPKNMQRALFSHYTLYLSGFFSCSLTQLLRSVCNVSKLWQATICYGFFSQSNAQTYTQQYQIKLCHTKQTCNANKIKNLLLTKFEKLQHKTQSKKSKINLLSEPQLKIYRRVFVYIQNYTKTKN
eukprot:TRINITY_DN1403_c0_g1_i5.p3 TRINITY_DN1403_c0_g1~~TRINITY_DN1403_c0_g1_i5.p3  ORF type:complete len:229 (+),score=-10.73 TRINITY_DN1403_c0_g1_i5:37-687(+)